MPSALSLVHSVCIPSMRAVLNSPALVPARYSSPSASGSTESHRTDGPGPLPSGSASRFPLTASQVAPASVLMNTLCTL